MADNSTTPYSHEAKAAIAIVMTLMIILTIVGNILVIIAVLMSRSLRGPQNLFLVSLAVADVLVGLIVVPFSMAYELQGKWVFGSIWCEIHKALDVLFCTASIVHLCAIALDRYLSISRPVSYGTKRSRRRIKSAIVMVWLIAAVISFPPLLFPDKQNGGDSECEPNKEPWYILYSSIGSFFAPCVIMILVYIRIYQIAKRHMHCPPGEKRRSIYGAATDDTEMKSLPEESQKDVDQRAPAAPELSLTTVHTDCAQWTDKKPAENPTEGPPLSSTGAPNAAKDLPKAEGEDAVHTSSSESDTELQSIEGGDRAGGGGSPKAQVQNPTCRYKNTIKTSSGTKLLPEDTAKTQETPISRHKAMMNREKRFTFVLAVVMGVFVVCWFPFFFSYSLKAVCPDAFHIPEPLFRFFFWSGYCNSSLNPIIYTIFNRDFRTAFKRILFRDMKSKSF
uniref:Alpha-2B adrenergic receptor n=1 Tax=Oryzias sinensis TaxID=183150 RepID=A0A8C7ZSS4_9TELE